MVQKLRSAATALLVVGLAAVICLLAPNPRSVVLAARQPQRYVDSVGPDEAALTGLAALAWCVLAWFALGLAFAAAGALPGAIGRWCDRAADRVLPTALRRTAALVLGVSVATTGGAASAKSLFAVGGPPRGFASISLADPVDRHLPAPELPKVRPDWPTTPPTTPSPTAQPPTAPSPTAPPPTAQPPTAQPPTAQPPTAQPPTAPTVGIDPDWPTTGPVQRPAPAVPPAGHEPRTVVVHAGDTLWDLAAARLERQLGHIPAATEIAAEWPRWYAANRAVVGADPNVLHPGQELVVPR